jgi:hypothetical protein
LQISYSSASDAVAQNQGEECNYLNPYALHKYSIRSELTQFYDGRLRKFLDFIQFETEIVKIEKRRNDFAEKGKGNNGWALDQIISFLNFQKERVEVKEITVATSKNFIRSLKVFCDSSDLDIPWKKITNMRKQKHPFLVPYCVRYCCSQ